MIIDFNHIETKKLSNFQSGEKDFQAEIFVDERNKILHGKLEPGASIGLHTHDMGSEIIYILEGKGKVLFNGEEEKVIAGQCHYCPKGSEHSLINNNQEDLVFFAVVANQ